MRLALVGAAVFILALARSMADGVGLGDESWFLQVIARIRAGDVLYREVFLGVTPLSAYLTAATTFITGIDVIAVKIVTNGCFAVTAMLAFRLAERAGLSSLASLAIVGAMFVWGRPYNNPPYTAMAVTCLVAVMLTIFNRTSTARPSSMRGWFVVGALAGLSFGAKQNVGLLALGVIWGAVFLTRAPGSVRHLFWSTTGFGATAVAVLVPVAASGALAEFWDYGFAAKGPYLNVGAVPYADSLRVVVSSMMSLPSSAPDLLHDITVLLPIAVLMSAIATVRRLDRTDWILLMFAAAATLVAFPRWDRFHMGYAVPVHLIALRRMARHWFPSTWDPASAWSAGFARHLKTAAAWSLASLTTMVAVQPAAIVARGARLSPMPHFRGALMSPVDAASLTASAARLRQAAGGQPVFVLTPHSGFWYLASGVTNPTPMDTPARTATGRNGIPWLIEQFDSLAIDRVCVLNGPPDAQTLTEIITYVRANFVEGTNVGPCTMFHAMAFALDLRRVPAL